MNINIKNQDKVKISSDSLYSKFLEVCEESNKVSYNSNNHIVCPYCQTVIKPDDINNISNFCYITFNDNDDLIYRVLSLLSYKKILSKLLTKYKLSILNY